MGWASGSILFSEIIDTLSDSVDDTSTREQIYEKLIYAFEDADCDTLDECLGKDKAFDNVYKEIYGETNDVDDYNDDD